MPAGLPPITTEQSAIKKVNQSRPRRLRRDRGSGSLSARAARWSSFRRGGGILGATFVVGAGSGGPAYANDRHRGRAGLGGQAASFSLALALIIAAPFSAIMIVGALVFVELTAGITEASMIRSASSPWTRSWSSTTDMP